MKIVIFDKGNSRFAITIDSKDDELRLKMRKNSTSEQRTKAIQTVQAIIEHDFSMYPTLRGNFNNHNASSILLTSKKKRNMDRPKYFVEVKRRLDGTPYRIIDRRKDKTNELF